MKILIAPDSFKESLSSKKVAFAIQQGFKRGFPSAQTECIALADGGEGTLSVLVANRHGKIQSALVKDPLLKPVRANYGWIDHGTTAIVEVAESCGLALVPKGKRNPLHTSSYGAGELIQKSLDSGCNKVFLTLGGVATHDAGVGMAQALGYRFLDRNGKEIPSGANGLKFLHKINQSSIHPRLKKVQFTAACDVHNPLCGPHGSARVYGPQKGATPQMVREIESALRHLALVVERDLKIDILKQQSGGAAGGMGAGAKCFLNAELKSGVEMVLEATHLQKKMEGTDLVITGEGKIDNQTLFGKVPMGVARLAKSYPIPVIAFCGRLEGNLKKLHASGLTAIFPISPGPISEEESIQDCERLLKHASEEVGRLIRNLYENI